MWNKEIRDFVVQLNKNAPLNSGEKGEICFSGYKYPYKPILIISILEIVKDSNFLFNNKIYINNDSPITKMYYDLLTNSPIFFNFLKTHKSKEAWYEIYNEDVKKQTVANIFENPAFHLQLSGSDFWQINRKEKWIKININDGNNLADLRVYLLECAKKCLWKCLPDYNGLSLDELINYENFLLQTIIDGSSEFDTTRIKTRKYQHIFSKIIFERDKKCRICCLDLPYLLQAAHIKPFSKCDNDKDRYSENNGILLCCNHHKLYDRGLFSFTDDWKVIVSKELERKDNDLLIKTFEPCFMNISNDLSKGKSTEYIKYHYDNIFKH